MGAGFQIQGSHVQNHWVAPRSTQLFILLRSIKWIPVISGKRVVKSKLPHHSGSVALRQLNPSTKRGHKVLLAGKIQSYLPVKVRAITTYSIIRFCGFYNHCNISYSQTTSSFCTRLLPSNSVWMENYQMKSWILYWQ